jgi:hypothetical protein
MHRYNQKYLKVLYIFLFSWKESFKYLKIQLIPWKLYDMYAAASIFLQETKLYQSLATTSAVKA